ncbi:MAG: fused signal recognition particle receptor, partial [Pseudonocardiales bacterium]|nr:fused signal recognition particle receptor [Pseudonocardiales bacterium]
MSYVWIALAVVVVGLALAAAFIVPRRRSARVSPPRPDIVTVDVVGREAVSPEVAALDVPEPTAGRLVRLRGRLARSQSGFGRGLLSVLSRERLDDDAWEAIEEALLTADVGVALTTEIVERLRSRTKVLGTASQGELRALLADELVTALHPEMDRSLHTLP